MSTTAGWGINQTRSTVIITITTKTFFKDSGFLFDLYLPENSGFVFSFYFVCCLFSLFSINFVIYTFIFLLNLLVFLNIIININIYCLFRPAGNRIQ